MRFAIRTHIPADSIAGCVPARIPLVLGVGVHGWGGRWAVNGSRAGAVRLDPPSRARVCGIPVGLRTLWLSLADPDEFVRVLSRGDGSGSRTER
ncbi:hypothetical protein [Pseudonocardia zijingensis]|jgi:hypothetical protein|uniref:Uncharacterized protein n=1 Tax=Pseudonocardia zijingensis TaxID=153376 RepID=A0ABP3ZRI5_9PSEU